VTAARDQLAAAVAALRRRCGLPTTSDRRGPVLLDPVLRGDEPCARRPARPDPGGGSRLSAADGVPVEDLGDAAERLAGFVFLAGRVGWAFVNADDILPRRRFSAAHELGHFVLHRETMGRFRADTDAMLQEANDELVDGMEREANQFRGRAAHAGRSV